MKWMVKLSHFEAHGLHMWQGRPARRTPGLKFGRNLGNTNA